MKVRTCHLPRKLSVFLLLAQACTPIRSRKAETILGDCCYFSLFFFFKIILFPCFLSFSLVLLVRIPFSHNFFLKTDKILDQSQILSTRDLFTNNKMVLRPNLDIMAKKLCCYKRYKWSGDDNIIKIDLYIIE